MGISKGGHRGVPRRRGRSAHRRQRCRSSASRDSDGRSTTISGRRASAHLRPPVDGAARDAGAPVDAAFVRRFYDRVAPGIYGDFDAGSMLALIAPRPVLVINGDSDARTPLAGVQEAVAAARRTYIRMGAEDKLGLYLQPNAGHVVTPVAELVMADWFVKWLPSQNRVEPVASVPPKRRRPEAPVPQTRRSARQNTSPAFVVHCHGARTKSGPRGRWPALVFCLLSLSRRLRLFASPALLAAAA